MPIYHQDPGNDSPSQAKRHPYESFACSLLQCGPIALYKSKSTLAEDMEKLAAEGFKILEFKTEEWGAGINPYAELKMALGLPEYCGENLNALADCMEDLSISDNGGLALVFEDYDKFEKRNRPFALGLLDTFSRGSRLLQLFGKTVIVMVQTNDPNTEFLGLGATSAWWNNKEFVRENR